MKRVPTDEWLDSDLGTPAEVSASLNDLKTINAKFGGAATTESMIRRIAKQSGTEVIFGSGSCRRRRPHSAVSPRALATIGHRSAIHPLRSGGFALGKWNLRICAGFRRRPRSAFCGRCVRFGGVQLVHPSFGSRTGRPVCPRRPSSLPQGVPHQRSGTQALSIWRWSTRARRSTAAASPATTPLRRCGSRILRRRCGPCSTRPAQLASRSNGTICTAWASLPGRSRTYRCMT